MAKLSAPKKPTAKAAPKKPTSRSKTGNAACSEAASNWQLSLRGKAALSPDTYKTLAKCRSLNRAGKMAEAQGRTGKLSEMGEAAVKGRLQARFDSDLVTQKARTEKLNLLLKQRSERGKLAAPKLAPGRGTEERKQLASEIRTLRNVDRGSAPVESAKTIRSFNDSYSELEYRMKRYAPSQRVEIAKQWETTDLSQRSNQALLRDRWTITEQVYQSGKLPKGATNEQAMSLIQQQRQKNDMEIAKSRRMHLSTRVAGKVYGGEAAAALHKMRFQGPPKPDQAVVNVPLDKRGGGSLNSQIDRSKRETQQAATQKRKSDRKAAVEAKAEAKSLYQTHGEALIQKTVAKHGVNPKEAKKTLESMIKWEPEKARDMLRRESAPTPPKPVEAKPGYSLGGKLAPGRGTEERKAIAKTLVQNREMTRGIYGPKIEYAELVRRQETDANAPVQPESPWLAGKPASMPAKAAPSPARNEAAKVLSDLRKKGLRYEAKEVRRIAREQVATESRDTYNTAVARGERGHDRLKSLTLGTAEKSAAVPQRIVQVARDTGLSQPARYSLGGKLAPGWGTEERKARAKYKLSVRKGNLQGIADGANMMAKAKGFKPSWKVETDKTGNSFIRGGVVQWNLSVLQDKQRIQTRNKLAR